jgi:hypothetical protein
MSGDVADNPLELEECPAYSAKDLTGHPLLYMFLAHDFGGHLVSSASECIFTVVNVQYLRVN